MNTPSISKPDFRSLAILLGASAGALMLAHAFDPAPARAQAAPDTIVVPGIVRDFPRTHPDFNIVPASGLGHYAGSVAQALGANFKPQFQPGGYKVSQEWRNWLNLPIAPHLFSSVSPIQLTTAPSTSASSLIDSYDPDTGSYDIAPAIEVGADMPTITPPTDLGPSIGDFLMTSDPETISTSFLCDSFTTRDAAIMRISGDVTIHCQGNFTMQQQSRIELQPGATLKVYVGGSFKTFHSSMLNANTLDPRLTSIYNYGTFTNDISQDSIVSAIIISPDAPLSLGQDVEFFGAYAGSTIDLNQGSSFHSIELMANDACGATIDDTLGLAGAIDTGAINSSASFDAWYNDMLGTNLSQIHYLTLTRDAATGVYSYSDSAFHPIDNRLFGNEGDAHNHFFTYSFTAALTYESCVGQFFSFNGADDVWMFINGQLVLDIGGVQPGTPQTVELDRLNLVDGQSYSMQFFYAQRSPLSAEFDLRTNVVIVPPAVVATGTGSFD